MGLKDFKMLICDRSGQAMVEFVIIMPVLLLLFLAIIFFGKAYLIKANTYTAARYYTWSKGRGVGVNNDKLNELFFKGDPSKIEIEPAGAPSFFGIPELSIISEIFDVLGSTEMQTVSYRLGPIPFQGGEIKISSSHYVDIDPWKGKSMAAITLVGIGYFWGYFVDPVKIPVPPCPSVGSIVGDLLSAVLKTTQKEALQQVVDTSVNQVRDSISGYASEYIEEEFLNKLENSIEEEASDKLSGVLKGIEEGALGQLSGFVE